MKMTDAEWMEQYPEDWHHASEADNYSSSEYDFIWSRPDFTHFRLLPLLYVDNASYTRYQTTGLED